MLRDHDNEYCYHSNLHGQQVLVNCLVKGDKQKLTDHKLFCFRNFKI